MKQPQEKKINCLKCHSTQHSAKTCISREEFKGTPEEFNKLYEVVPSLPKAEEESWEVRFEEEIVGNICDDNPCNYGLIKSFISQKLQDSYYKGWNEGQMNVIKAMPATEHDTEPDYCCACEYDQAVMEDKIECSRTSLLTEIEALIEEMPCRAEIVNEDGTNEVGISISDLLSSLSKLKEK